MFNVTRLCREINFICRKHLKHRQSIFSNCEQSLKCPPVKGKPLDSVNWPVCAEMWRSCPAPCFSSLGKAASKMSVWDRLEMKRASWTGYLIKSHLKASSKTRDIYRLYAKMFRIKL